MVGNWMVTLLGKLFLLTKFDYLVELDNSDT